MQINVVTQFLFQCLELISVYHIMCDVYDWCIREPPAYRLLAFIFMSPVCAPLHGKFRLFRCRFPFMISIKSIWFAFLFKFSWPERFHCYYRHFMCLSVYAFCELPRLPGDFIGATHLTGSTTSIVVFLFPQGNEFPTPKMIFHALLTTF